MPSTIISQYINSYRSTTHLDHHFSRKTSTAGHRPRPNIAATTGLAPLTFSVFPQSSPRHWSTLWVVYPPSPLDKSLAICSANNVPYPFNFCISLIYVGYSSSFADIRISDTNSSNNYLCFVI